SRRPVGAEDVQLLAEVAGSAGIRLRRDPGKRADRLQAGRVERVQIEVVRPVPEPPLRNWCAAERDQDEQDDEDPTPERDPVALEPPPHLLPVAAGLDLSVRL